MNYTEILKSIKELMMKLHTWRFVAIMATGIAMMLIWQFANILQAAAVLIQTLK